jgi:HlyD family secretion protein
MRRWVLMSLLLAGCGERDADLRFVGTLERDRIEIVAERDEPIVAVEVREGDRVRSGQILLRQATEAAGARAAQADAAVAEARQRLVELERGERPEVRAEARARVAAARAALDRDERELVRARELVVQRLVSASRVDEASAARDTSAARLKESQAQLLALERGTRVEQLEQAKAALAAAEATRAEIGVTDARLVVRATRDGVVDALPYELGERPPRGAPVAVLLASGAPYARTYVPEAARASARPGTPARVYVDGVDQPLHGRLRFIATEASFTPYYALTQRDRGRLAFLAEVEVHDPAALDLPAGIPLEVELVESR